MQISRLDRLSYIQTMLYEIEMLRETARRYGKRNEEMDKRICLESFLLHFRNLIQFFGPIPKPLRTDDLHITKTEDFWSDANRPDEKVLAGLRLIHLWDTYENPGPAKDRPTISKYLHHCTKRRIAPKIWVIGTMFGEVNPTLLSFENLVDKNRTAQVPAGADIPSSLAGATGPAPPALKKDA
jgi:hypothetical protein